MSERQRGFTLIELLIVIAIIGIIAGIALPNFVRSRMMANEAATKGDLREIHNAQTAIHVEHGAYYDLICLAVMLPCGSQPPGCPCIGEPYMSPGLAAAQGANSPRAGYVRAFVPGNPLPGGGTDRFCYQATPQVPGQTGMRSFGIDSRGFIGATQDAVSCCGAGGALNTAACPVIN